MRFHRSYMHLDKVFGSDWFALKAEAFARFFGTPVFLVGQALANRQTAALAELLDRNTKLTEMTHELSRRIEQLTTEMHAALVRGSGALRVEVAGPAGGGARS